MARSKIVLVFIFTVSFFLSQITALADYNATLDTQGWRIIQTRYSTIFCHPDVDINRLNSKIQVRFYDIDWGRFSAKNKTVEAQVIEKVDRIFRKVQKILDMYPRKMHFNIKIFKTQAQLDKEYAKIFGFKSTKRTISFYVHKYTTIFTSEQMISEGVIAHEMGHAVVDHYFLILPPENVQELLSQYVELHLEE